MCWFCEDGEDWMVDFVLKCDICFVIYDICDVVLGWFDFILCCNVLMYFVVFLCLLVFDWMVDVFDFGGILMLGVGEIVFG